MVRAQLEYFDQRYLRDEGNDVCWVDTGASRTVHSKTCRGPIEDDSSPANVRSPMDCSHLREIVSIASRSYTLPKSRWPPNSGLFPVDKLADSRRCIAAPRG